MTSKYLELLWQTTTILILCQLLIIYAAVLKKSSSSSSLSSGELSRARTTPSVRVTSLGIADRDEDDDDGDDDDEEEDDNKSGETDEDDRLSGLWLDDFDSEPSERDDDDMMLSDSPQSPDDASDSVNSNEDEDQPSCPPPVPSGPPPNACHVPQCSSDKQCSGGNLCCNNGCKYTCMTPIRPAPFVDWKRQPRRRLASGLSWLIPGLEENEEVEWCSTTEVYEEDEDPLLCPHGYFCYIEDPGDPEHNIPNRGKCLQEFSVVTKKDLFNGNGTEHINCEVGSMHYNNGTTVEIEGHRCVCRQGEVLCPVAKHRKRKPRS